MHGLLPFSYARAHFLACRIRSCCCYDLVKPGFHNIGLLLALLFSLTSRTIGRPWPPVLELKKLLLILSYWNIY